MENDSRKACEGEITLEDGDYQECLHCGSRVAWDFVDHDFFGFEVTCPLKRKALRHEPFTEGEAPR